MTRSASDAALYEKIVRSMAAQPRPLRLARAMKLRVRGDSRFDVFSYTRAEGFVAGYLAAQRAGKRGKNTKARAAPKGKR